MIDQIDIIGRVCGTASCHRTASPATQFGPFEPALVHIALAKAILDKKTDQPISFYLDYIIKTYINHQQKEQSA